MYVLPAYLWAITIAGPTAIAAATCIVLGAVSGTVTVAGAAGLGSSEHLAARP